MYIYTYVYTYIYVYISADFTSFVSADSPSDCSLKSASSDTGSLRPLRGHSDSRQWGRCNSRWRNDTQSASETFSDPLKTPPAL